MQSVKSWLSDKRWLWKYKMAKSRYDSAIPGRYYLPESCFAEFVASYGHLKARPFQEYSEEALVARARERSSLLLTKAGGKVLRALEIGASDGMVLKELLANGVREAVAVDIVDQLHPQAKSAGVQLVQTSAEDLSILETGSFDMIYSWGSLEHIPDMKRVVDECLRLLGPGGTLYLEAGPLYFSPWGFHYYSILKVPYLHLLFPESLLHEYAKSKHGPGYRDFFPWTNGRPASDYIDLVRNLPSDFIVSGFWHGYDWFSTGLVAKYPDVFKAKRLNFHDFFIDGIRMTLKRKSCY